MSVVTNVKAAAPKIAQAHYQSLLSLETDCWDVHHAIKHGRRNFILLDVRDQEAYQRGHLPEAVNLPHPRINQGSMLSYDSETLLVVYCAGPHCNGADKAALRLAKLGRPVKKMIGGITGWLDEGFELAR